jgi:phenylalanyl-tRNA synthetase alpha chain
MPETLEIISQIESEAVQAFQAAKTTAELKESESKFLGKKGAISGLMGQLGKIPQEERPAFGKAVNEAKARAEEAYQAQHKTLKAAERAIQFEAERIDITIPGRKSSAGREHILQLTTNRIKEVFIGLGFEYAESPELEKFEYNFSVLNYPEDHPAMDEQDTFYVNDNLVLRTQCTALQGHIFETRQPPLRIFTVGRTYRNEAVDRTHSHTFHQVDCFMIDEGVNMAQLKGTLNAFASAMFGDDVKVRFRPDFFPFVEPGVDYAISSPKLFGGRWVELGGAGMIHPNILKKYGIDTEKYTGWAFGLGVERIPMMAMGVDDLRNFLENDLRFLNQFA